jgi:hypothetical protein
MGVVLYCLDRPGFSQKDGPRPALFAALAGIEKCHFIPIESGIAEHPDKQPGRSLAEKPEWLNK